MGLFDDLLRSATVDTDTEGEYDPFESIGSAQRPLGIKRVETSSIPDVFGARESFEAIPPPKVKMVKDSAQYKRAIKLVDSLYPGCMWQRTEWKVSINGMLVTRDLWGFADILGQRRIDYGIGIGGSVWGCQDIAVQLTTLDQIGPHIRKYVSEEAKSADEIRTEEKLRHFLRCGNIFLILGYYKEAGRWQCKRTIVTEAMLDEAIKRKRPRKASSQSC